MDRWIDRRESTFAGLKAGKDEGAREEKEISRAVTLPASSLV
jgi:hypothetical protein